MRVWIKLNNSFFYKEYGEGVRNSWA